MQKALDAREAQPVQQGVFPGQLLPLVGNRLHIEKRRPEADQVADRPEHAERNADGEEPDELRAELFHFRALVIENGAQEKCRDRRGDNDRIQLRHHSQAQPDRRRNDRLPLPGLIPSERTVHAEHHAHIAEGVVVERRSDVVESREKSQEKNRGNEFPALDAELRDDPESGKKSHHDIDGIDALQEMKRRSDCPSESVVENLQDQGADDIEKRRIGIAGKRRHVERRHVMEGIIILDDAEMPRIRHSVDHFLPCAHVMRGNVDACRHIIDQLQEKADHDDEPDPEFIGYAQYSSALRLHSCRVFHFSSAVPSVCLHFRYAL